MKIPMMNACLSAKVIRRLHGSRFRKGQFDP
uniref:Uncharacterized protein n=1 Tax=Anopheles dirus TaxID=7168 RepID=A0A182NXC0_9DIPT